MNLLWTILVTVSSVLAGSGLCFWLLYQAREVDASVWILEHILCPIVRIFVLLIVVSQIYPAIDPNLSSPDFWRVLISQGHFNDLVNLLFFAGLALSFIPLVNHPILALPLQSIFSIAVVFRWQHRELIDSLHLFPSMFTLLKIIAFMTFAYFVTREASIPISRWLDHRYAVSGSIHLTADAIYLVLQVPVILLYCSYLQQQLA